MCSLLIGRLAGQQTHRHGQTKPHTDGHERSRGSSGSNGGVKAGMLGSMQGGELSLPAKLLGKRDTAVVARSKQRNIAVLPETPTNQGSKPRVHVAKTHLLKSRPRM